MSYTLELASPDYLHRTWGARSIGDQRHIQIPMRRDPLEQFSPGDCLAREIKGGRIRRQIG